MSNQGTGDGHESAWGEFVVGKRWIIIVFSILLAFGLASGMRFLTLDTDSRVYLAPDNPDRVALETLEATYTKDNSLLVVLAPKNGDIYTKETLGVVKEITEAGWQTPFSRRVDSLTNFQYSRADGDELIIEDFVLDPESMTDEDLSKLREVAVTRKPLYGKVVSEKGDVTAINITVLNPGESQSEIPEIVTYVRAMVSEIGKQHPEIDFYLTGGVMIDMTFAEASQEDTKTLIPAMLIAIMLIVGFTLRTFWGVVSTLFVIILSIISTMGLAGWTGFVINSSTAAAPVIIMTLAVADSVHLLASHYFYLRNGKDKHGAVKESIRVNMGPVFVTSLTTAVGFLTLNFSESPPLQELGTIVASGVTFAFFYSVFFLPSMMSMLPGRAKESANPNALMDGISDFVVAKRKILLPVIGLVSVVLALGSFKIVLDDDFIRYFDHRYQFRVDADFTQDNLTGLHALEFSLPSGEEGGITNPEYLAKVDAFAEWFRQQDKVVHVSALTDTIKRLHENVNADDPQYYRIPDTSEAAAQFLMLYELSVPYGLDLNSQMDIGKSSSRFTATVVNTTADDILALVDKSEGWLKQNAPEMYSKATGMSVAVSHISGNNIESMLGGTIGALVIISFILYFVLRNAKIAVISLAPNLMPAAIAFGIWGFLFTEVNLAIAVVVAMTLGIVVDDTVHMLSKYLRARREYGHEPEEAVRYAIRTVGTAMGVTTFALVVGFGILATSGFAVNGDMGLLSAITIGVALITDMLFLPPLLMLFERK
ncbi:RND family transporter [Magnetospira sp. QH-2]|uniref:efflux RND transporter permease subunit n=1 Tax=Magnetospira sp. (strain QH-2) TaxID=1288970 RepID=UPI0005F9ADE0|nr:MMPL family transporter [Magnetospira sp. QH-2]